MKRVFALIFAMIFVAVALFPIIKTGTDQNNYTVIQDVIISDSNGDIISNNIIDDELPRIYFVIGIGIYIEGGTWPVYEFISPVFLIRFGKPSGPHILTVYSGESIDFIEGDKFLGYYPFLNPIGIGFVCGIWINV